VSDSDDDGIAGTGVPVVDANGLVTSITYSAPTNGNWQEPTIGVCLPVIYNEGIDNDGDGLIDCEDPECASPTANPATLKPIYPTYRGGRYTQKGQQHLFKFTDNGIGVPDMYRELIFKPFKTLNNKSLNNSAGLGLAISKSIIEKSGGKIWLTSNEQGRSSFEFLI